MEKDRKENRAEDLPPCLILIDKDGRWYHKGAEMIHREFIRLFYQNMLVSPDGNYIIDWNGQRCLVDVEDTAFVVWSVSASKGKGSGNDAFVIGLSDDTKEFLRPETLRVGKDNVLYCDVKDLAFPARFNRASYYQLAEFIEEEHGTFYLPLNGNRYGILNLSAGG